MLSAAADIAPVAVNNEQAMASYESVQTGTSVGKGGPERMQVKYVPAIAILNSRGEFSASMGVLPPWIRPWIKKIPWYARGNVAVKNLAGIAVAAVGKRLASDAERGEGVGERVDLLRRLQEARDDNGQRMGKEELTAEALTQLIAGSDTTSKYVTSNCQASSLSFNLMFISAVHPVQLPTILRRTLRCKQNCTKNLMQSSARHP